MMGEWWVHLYMVDMRARYNIEIAGMRGKYLGADPGTAMN